MPDLRNIRPRPGVRIQLHPYDIADIVTQPEVMASFTIEELQAILATTQAELNNRTKGEVNVTRATETK